MGRVISSFVYNVSCTYTRVDIVKHIQTRISGSCTGVQMEEVYKSTPFLSRILFQKHHIHSGLQRTTSLGYPPQLPHRRRQDIHLFIHSFIRSFIHLFIYRFIPSSYCTGGGRIFIFIFSFILSFAYLPILLSFHSFILPFILFYLFILHLVILSFIFYFLEPCVFSGLLYLVSAKLFYFVRFSLIYFYFSKIGKAKSFKCNKLQNVYYNLSN